MKFLPFVFGVALFVCGVCAINTTDPAAIVVTQAAYASRPNPELFVVIRDLPAGANVPSGGV